MSKTVKLTDDEAARINAERLAPIITEMREHLAGLRPNRTVKTVIRDEAQRITGVVEEPERVMKPQDAEAWIVAADALLERAVGTRPSAADDRVIDSILAARNRLCDMLP